MKKKDMWNGGKTNYKRMIRESEDFHDTIDSELEDREELKARQVVMLKTKITPMDSPHPINQDMNVPTKITGMGGRGGPIASLRSKKNG